MKEVYLTSSSNIFSDTTNKYSNKKLDLIKGKFIHNSPYKDSNNQKIDSNEKIENNDNIQILSSSNTIKKIDTQIYNILNNDNTGNGNFEMIIYDNSKMLIKEKEKSEIKNCLGISINISRDSSISENENDKRYLAKWNKYLCENKLKLEELNYINEPSNVILRNNLDNTGVSDDIENINKIMEEKMILNLYENGFLKQLYHSIVPFILIQNKEIHRMCLSDYELKIFYKTYNKKRSESERKNPYESYRQGIIKFYNGKYLDSYSHFKSAHIKKENDLNIAKWLAFTALILLMCNKKIDFSNIKNIKVETNKENDNFNNDTDNGIFFSCCSSRKNDFKINIFF